MNIQHRSYLSSLLYLSSLFLSFANAADNSIYIQQTGNGDVFSITQSSSGNSVGGAEYSAPGINPTTYAQISSGNNHVTIRQGDFLAQTGNNKIALAVLGSDNILNLDQGTNEFGYVTGLDQGNHYQIDYVKGFANIVTVVQENTTTNAGMFSSLELTGNFNTVGIIQTGSAANQLFANIYSNNNLLSTNQSGTSPHSLTVTESGSGNSAKVNQNNTGAIGSNVATINLINNGAPASVNLTQTGGQNYMITQSCMTACGTVMIKQGN